MGQRLVITCKYKGEDVANIYYHWSAYTISALYEARELLDYVGTSINPFTTIEELQLKLIEFAESHGGGISGGKDSDEWKYITTKFPTSTFKAQGISRNAGLIAISDKGMVDSAAWGEGYLVIDFDKEIISNDCYYIMDLDEYIDEYLGGTDEHLYVPEVNIDLNNIPFKDINDAINQLADLDCYCFCTPNSDKIIAIIG